MLMQILAPLYLPVLHLVTLATVPVTAVYALLGLVTAPITIPLLIITRLVGLVLFSPLLLATLPISIPVGGLLAFKCTVCHVMCAFFTVFTPLLWPLHFLCKWYHITCCISQTILIDTIMPWLVPLRFTFLAILLPKLAMK